MATSSYVNVPEKGKFIYSCPDRHRYDICSQQYFPGSAGSGEFSMQSNFHSSKSHQMNRMMFHTQSSSGYHPCTSPGSSDIIQDSCSSSDTAHIRHHQNSSPETSHILDTSLVGCDAGETRKILNELEIKLLYDNEPDDLNGSEDICLNGDWAESIENLLLSNSPKELSSHANLSCNIEISNAAPLLNHREMVGSLRNLLFDCAVAASENQVEKASNMINDLRQIVSIQGDPLQRVTTYMVEGLAARLAYSGSGLYKALNCKEPPTSDRLSAMQVLFEICPCFKFGFMAANGAIAEALKDEKCVHIIDFDINQGSQYMTLIQALSTRKTSNPTRVRITGVDDPDSVQRAVGGLRAIGQRLEMLAQVVGVPLEFRAVPAKTCDVCPDMLGLRPREEEALIVNFAFQLHHMPDESVSTVNQRDRLLRMVKSLGPKLVTIVEQDLNTNTAPFLARFHEVYDYYYAIFESLDVTMPRQHADRMNVELQCLARDIVNIVACEGEERIERYEVAGKWRARMMMAGFEACPLSAYVNDTIRTLLHRSYCDRYKVKEDDGALYFGWDNKNLVVASAWR